MKHIYSMWGFNNFFEIGKGKFKDEDKEQYFVRMFENKDKNYVAIAFDKHVLEEIRDAINKELKSK